MDEGEQLLVMRLALLVCVLEGEQLLLIGVVCILEVEQFVLMGLARVAEEAQLLLMGLTYVVVQDEQYYQH